MASVNEVLSKLLGGSQRQDGRDSELLGPLADLIQRQGGIDGLVSQLRSKGLGDQVTNWSASGEQTRADPRQLARALGPDSMRELARKSGLPVERVVRDLGEVIPHLLARVSADGTIPGSGQAAGLARRIPGTDRMLDQAGRLGGRRRSRRAPGQGDGTLPPQREEGDT